MAWNLADQFNTDLERGSVFDNLPAQTSQLRRDEMLKTDAGKLNTSAEGSFVPDSKIAPLEDPRTRSELNSTSRQLKAEETGNVFDSFEPPKKTPAPQEQQEPPKELTLGEIISEGYGIISQVKGLKNGRTGANAREVAREKALDEQFIGMVYSRMGDLFEERNLDRNLVERLGTRPGGGYRTAEEIDRVDRIRREGATIKVDGQEITLPKDMDWDQAFEADKLVWASSVKAAKTKEDDSIERATKAQSLIDAISKKENRTDEDEMALQKLGAERDAAMQLPQGASKLGAQLNRYFRQNQELEEAKNMGLDTYDGVTADQFDTRIAENMNRIQAIAIKNAPSFKDSAERDAWLRNKETKNLPFKMAIGGKPTVVYATEDPNVVTSYVANGKQGPQWITHSLVQKTQEPEKPAESKAAQKTDTSKVSVSEEIKANLTTASSAKEKLDKMWTGGYAVSPDKAQREEYAATKEELNENLAPVYAQIRKLEQEVRDTGYPNFRGDASLNKERLKQIKELRKQIPLGHRLGKELLGLGKPAAKQSAAPQPAPVEAADETNPLLQNWEGITSPRTQSVKGMENVGLVMRGLPSKQSTPAAKIAPNDESNPWGDILRPRSQNIRGMGNVGFLNK
jgi:hypothetical protein